MKNKVVINFLANLNLILRHFTSAPEIRKPLLHDGPNAANDRQLPQALLVSNRMHLVTV